MTPRRRRLGWVMAAGALVLAAAAGWTALDGPRAQQLASAPADPVESAPQATARPSIPADETQGAEPPPDEPDDPGQPSGTAADVQAADPISVNIPAIGVAADTIPLGLRDDGSIEVPERFEQTGWWRDGPEPGEAGPAVILGHVDSRHGPAVFHQLRDLEVGDPIVIDRADGTTVTYVVERLEQHPKDDFPTEAVYGPTDDSVLRLVTCGGTFDRSARSYTDNVIVFATLDDV